jgi:hypothetical protein
MFNLELERPYLAQRCKEKTYKLKKVKLFFAGRESEGLIVRMILQTTKL